MPRHLGPDDHIVISGGAMDLGTLLGSENFDSGTIGTDIEPNTFLTDAFYTGDLTFEAGGYTGQRAACVAAGSHFLEHSMGGSFPDWRDAGTVVVKFKVDSLPTTQWTVLGGLQNAPNEDYVFGINTVGNIGIGYVNPSPSYQTTYAVAPEEWVKVAFTYINNDTLSLRLWHGANINGNIPDEIINSPQGSFQNLRYLIFGKNEGWGNTVAVSYDDLELYYGVPDWDTTAPQRSQVQFAGDGVTVSDNSGDESTDIDMPDGSSSPVSSAIGYAYWTDNSFSVDTAGPDEIELGTLSDDGGSMTWFDAGGSDLTTGLIVLAERGLFRFTHNLYYNIIAGSPTDNDLFGIKASVFLDGTLRYEVARSVKVIHYDGSNSNLTGSIDFTDVFEIGGSVQFSLVKPAAGMTTRTVFTELWVERII